MIRVAALVPAAGRSQRMGRPKLILGLGTESVIQRVVIALERGGAEPVLVTHATIFPTPPTEEDELLLLMWEHNSRATAQVLLEFERSANQMMAAIGRRRGAMLVDAAAHMNGQR